MLLQTFDGINWNDVQWEIYTYDIDENLTSKVWQDWDGTNWVDQLQHTFNYDANDSVTSQLEQYWDGTNWVNTHKNTYTYDVNGNLSSYVYENWSFEWFIDYKNIYTYDANGSLSSIVTQHPNGTGWVNFYKYSYAYDPNGNLISSVNQRWGGSAWVNEDKCDYSYVELNTGLVSFLTEEGSSLSVFPNPFGSYARVSVIGEQFQNSKLTLVVYNLFGKEVISKQLNNDFTFKRNDLPSGIYIYRVFSNGEIIGSGKVIAE